MTKDMDEQINEIRIRLVDLRLQRKSIDNLLNENNLEKSCYKRKDNYLKKIEKEEFTIQMTSKK